MSKLRKSQKRKIATWLAVGEFYNSDKVTEKPIGKAGLETTIKANGFEVKSSSWYGGLVRYTSASGNYEGLLRSLGWVISDCPKCGQVAGLKHPNECKSPKCKKCKGHAQTQIGFFHL